jgi:tRNA dimethylallyltransferase
MGVECDRPFLMVLTGPTASGKTAVSLDWAERFGAEIVSADSMQVYRGMDVGTAKPTAGDRARAPHHLLDVADPDEPFDAVRFAALADEAIRGIAARGRRVLVAGGTGLYLRVLLFGLADLPPPAPAVRAALEAEADAEGSAALHRRLGERDPETAAAVHPSDRFRIVRAMEILETSGRRPSDVRAAHRFGTPRYRHLRVALVRPRGELRERILRRAREMVAGGLLEETAALLARGCSPDLRPLRAFGYREAVRCVRGERPAEGLAEAIARDTARYAKRQETWLRSDPGLVRISAADAAGSGWPG